jgi:dTDP-4-dehydrorhamnose reductase
MRILLTGGSGQLGRSILDQFSNCELNAPTRKSLDVTSTESINSALGTFKPDVIINAAAWTNVPKAEECSDEALKLNVNGVEKLAIAGNKIGAKFVQISTDYVFDGKSSIPYQED